MNFLVLNPAGTLSWSYYAGHQMTTSPSISQAGRIYLGAPQIGPSPSYAVFYSLNSSGSLMWSYRTGDASDGIMNISPAIDGEDRLIAGANDNLLYCISSTGHLV
jgi:outer membrane protein assembly factor BamB